MDATRDYARTGPNDNTETGQGQEEGVGGGWGGGEGVGGMGSLGLVDANCYIWNG